MHAGFRDASTLDQLILRNPSFSELIFFATLKLLPSLHTIARCDTALYHNRFQEPYNYLVAPLLLISFFFSPFLSFLGRTSLKDTGGDSRSPDDE